MQRHHVLIAVGVLAVLLIGGFGVARLVTARNSTSTTLLAARPSTCDDAFRVLKLTPSQIRAGRPVCLVQSLHLTGELNGSVGQAYTVAPDGSAPTPMCGTPKRWDNLPQVLLAFAIGGKAYRLAISPSASSEHQPLTLNNVQGQLDLASIADPKADWSQASGTVVINADAVTGSIDAQLQRDVSGARPVHITGNWACGTRLAPSADSSIPCSLFYTLNHLQDEDVARMKSSACKPEDLTFSGAISGHLDHAVNDAAYARAFGNYGDNYCKVAGSGAAYDASLKFSIGDESFLLDLYPRAYTSSIGPGQYPAGSSPLSANAFLWLGIGDATNHGLFVPDDHVNWFGSQGSFTIADDMKSGSLDETFSGVLQHSGSTVHVTGSWRCG